MTRLPMIDDDHPPIETDEDGAPPSHAGEEVYDDHPLGVLQNSDIERLIDLVLFTNHRAARALHAFAVRHPSGEQAWRIGLTQEACQKLAAVSCDELHDRLTSRFCLFELAADVAQLRPEERASAPYPAEAVARQGRYCLVELHDTQLQLRQECAAAGLELAPLLAGSTLELAELNRLGSMRSLIDCPRPLFRPHASFLDLVTQPNPLIRLGLINTVLTRSRYSGSADRHLGGARKAPMTYADRQLGAARYLRLGATVQVASHLAGLAPNEVRRVARQEQVTLRGGSRGSFTTALRTRRTALFCQSYLATIRAVEDGLDEVSRSDIIGVAGALHVLARAEIGALLDAAGEPPVAAQFQDPNTWFAICSAYLAKKVEIVTCRSCQNDLFLPQEHPRTFCHYCHKTLGET